MFCVMVDSVVVWGGVDMCVLIKVSFRISIVFVLNLNSGI